MLLTELSNLAKKLINSAKDDIQLWRFLLQMVQTYDLFVETSYRQIGLRVTMLLDCLEINVIAGGCGVMATFLREVGISTRIVVLAQNIRKVFPRNYERYSL